MPIGYQRHKGGMMDRIKSLKAKSNARAKKQNADQISSARKAAAKKQADAEDKKRRANRKKMLEAKMKGLREEGKHWEDYIKKTYLCFNTIIVIKLI